MDEPSPPHAHRPHHPAEFITADGLTATPLFLHGETVKESARAAVDVSPGGEVDEVSGSVTDAA